jgi:ABC-2 type transport system permease protein
MKGDKSVKERLLTLRPYLILLFIPMLFTVLFGEVMRPVFVENIPIAVFDMDHSKISRTVADAFYNCPVFDITEKYDSYEDIQEHILLGDISGAVILPEGFGNDLRAKKGANAEVLIDGSNFLIGNNIQLFSSTILATMNAGIQINLLEAGGMVPYSAEQDVFTLNIADRALYNPQFGYFYYLFAGLLGIFVQQTMLAVTPVVLINEKKRLKERNLGAERQRIGKGNVAYKLGIYILLNTISMLCCLILANKLYAYPIRGSLWNVLMLHGVFLLCMFGVSLVLATFFDDTTHCIQFVMFLAVPSFLSCGYGWPEYMMSAGFAPVMKALWPLYYYVNPMKDLMLKGAGWDVIGHYVTGGLSFAAVWIILGLVLYTYRMKSLKKLNVDYSHEEA